MSKNPFSRRIIKRTLGLTLVIVFLAVAYRVSVFRPAKNFHEVTPGQFYRSAQLTPEELQEVIDQYGIKTVISLRGASPKSPWFHSQMEVLNKNNVAFESFGWKTEAYPQTDDLQDYLKALKKVEYPVLVHCRSGADRTGLATTLYAIEVLGMEKQKAVDEYLNTKYLHLSFFQPAQKDFMSKYKGYEWGVSEYDACSDEFAKYRDIDQVCVKSKELQ